MSKSPSTEVEFLAAEAQAAREALGRLAPRVPDAALRAADVRAWTKRYPWQMLAAAVAAGVGGAMLLRKKPPPAAAAETLTPPRPARSRGRLKTLARAAAAQLWKFVAAQLSAILTAPKPAPADPHHATEDESADCDPTAP